MAIAYRSRSFIDNGGSAAQVVARPSGLKGGDSMLAGAMCRGNTTCTPPAGWTLVLEVGNAGSTDPKLRVYRKIAGGPVGGTTTEPSTYTFTFSASDGCGVGIVAYSGGSSSTPINVSASQINASSSNAAGPSATTTTDGCRLVRFYVAYETGASDYSMAPPSGWNERVDQDEGISGDAIGQMICDQHDATAGATGTATARLRHSSPSVAAIVALTPEPTAPAAPTLISPASGALMDLSGTPTFDWAFEKAGDSQSAFALRRKVGAGAYSYYRVSDGTWQATEQWNTQTATIFTFPTGKWSNGTTYSWSVATKDSLGLAGPYATDISVTGNVAPSVTVTTPSDPAITSRPNIQWTYSDAESDAQLSYRVKVFSEAQYTAVGFDPATSSPTWDSAEVISAFTSQPVGIDLADLTRYRAYVQVSQQLGPLYSAWGPYVEFTIDLDAPAQPVLTATADPTNSRVQLDAQGRDNLLTEEQASFEADSTLGWSPLANSTIDTLTFAPAAAHGLYGMRLTAAAAGDMSAITDTGLSGVPVEPSKQYTAVASFRSLSVARSAQVFVRWYSAAGAFISASNGNVITTTMIGWTQSFVTVTSPANAAFAAVAVQVLATGSAAEEHYADAISIAPGASTAFSRGGLVDATLYDLERSDDGGVTWIEVRGGTDLVPDQWQRLTLFDYEAPPNVAVQYRARVDATITPTVASEPSTPVTVTVTVTVFWLKDPRDPLLNQVIYLENEAFKHTSPEDQAVFNPLGRALSVVLSDVIRGERFTLQMKFYTEAAYEAFEALRAEQRESLFQTDMTDHWYVKLSSDRDTELINTADRRTAPFRRVTISAVEVDKP